MVRWGYGRRCLGGKCYYQVARLLTVCGVLLVVARTSMAESDAGKSISINDGTVSAEIEVIDAFQAEQEHLKKLLANKPKAYQDNFMKAGQLSGLATEPVESDSAPDGVRVFSLESRIDLADSTGTHVAGSTLATAGIRTEYRLETPNHGEIVFQLDARGRNTQDDTAASLLVTDGKQQNSRVTVRNIGLPVTSDVLADTAVGDINSDITDALGRNYRLSLGTSPVRGVGTHVYGKDFDLRAGSGRRGELRGTPYAGFELTDGNLSWLGYSRNLGDNLQAGVQINHAQDIPVTVLDTRIPAGQRENVSSLAASVGYADDMASAGKVKVRATIVSSTTSADIAGRDQVANGLFIEAGLDKGRFRHELGAYASQPNLHFGDSLLLSSSRGAHWKIERESAGLNLGGALDFEQSKPVVEADGLESTRVGASATAFYRLNRDDQLGGNLHISDTRTSGDDGLNPSDSHSRSANINVNYQTRFNEMGRSRFSATLRRNEALVSNAVAATGDEIQWEQDWITGKYETMRPELSTTLGIAHDRSDGGMQTYPTAAVKARKWLTNDWNISGNLRHTSRDGNLSTSQGLAGSLATEYKLGREWQLGASASLNEAQVTYSGNSLTAPEVVRTRDKHAYAYLRWQQTTGKPFQTLGSRQAGTFGSGDIVGTMFFDENRDGVQQAGETGSPGVEVVLDGHYRVITDGRGEFRFAQVVSGPHQLETNLDTVPLPWEVAQSAKKDVNVVLRDQASLKIPLIKIN